MMYCFMSEHILLLGIPVFATTALIRGMSIRCTRRLFGICNNTIMSKHTLLLGIPVFASAALVCGISIRCTCRFFGIRNNPIMSECRNFFFFIKIAVIANTP